MRHHYQELSQSVGHLETHVTDQSAQLERMNYNYDAMDDADVPQKRTQEITDEDIQRELDEIRELELRKRMLEDRVNGMERDLGGLVM